MTEERHWKPELEAKWQSWLRRQSAISSQAGFVASDVDLVWSNYKTGQWLILEVKCRKAQMRPFQRYLLGRLASLCKADPLFCGFHTLIFEGETPQDGRIWLDGKQIDERELIEFLEFRRLCFR